MTFARASRYREFYNLLYSNILFKLYLYYEFFLRASARPPNIGLTFKAWPERSEGLAWFLHCCSAKTMTKGFIRLKQLFDVLLITIFNELYIHHIIYLVLLNIFLKLPILFPFFMFNHYIEFHISGSYTFFLYFFTYSNASDKLNSARGFFMLI